MIDLPDFDELYTVDADPWRVASSFYERRKRAIVLASLSRERYGWAWDPACGTGHLALALSDRCDLVTATDASAVAARLAGELCAGRDNIQVGRAALPTDRPQPPTAHADAGLVVLAEFLYYLRRSDREMSIDVVAGQSEIGTEVLAVHWRHHPHDAFLSGADVQVEVDEGLRNRGWRQIVHLDDPDFILDSWRRETARTVSPE